MKWIDKNTYKIELPIHLDILGTFNVVDLTPYYSDDSTYDSRTSSFQLGKHNTGISSNGPIDVELFEFGLVMQMNEVLDVVYYHPMGQL